MSSYTVVAVDAMGGDNAPGEIVAGALQALAKNENVKVILVGREDAIRGCLNGKIYDADRLSVIHASEVIETGDPPVASIRHKKDSSIVVGQRLVKDGMADAFVSAGSTGAVLVGGQLIVGRLKGVDRTPLGTLIPTMKGVTLVIDCGANVDARSAHLVQFARMGSIYMENIMGIPNPTVGLLNIGVEEEKGNALVKETFPLLKACSDINFIGSVEAREIPAGCCDVVVCDAFVGNVMLKLYEGTAKALIGMVKQTFMTNLKTKLGALLIKNDLKRTLKPLDTAEHGGAPMLGLKGLVVKTHGSAKAKEVCNTILQCIAFKEQDIANKIKDALTENNKEEA